ncbi:hypothetical protein L218DRAFT_949225 [Marasmius fiardii PR-910]|nr:hypothetical protein L218DRAFT_949225 [Marasmius fiardii PR-910]
MEYIENDLATVKDAVLNDEPPRITSSPALEVREAISTLLYNPDFCPQGGLLGFPLSCSYRVGPGYPENLNDVLDWLKRRDDIMLLVCENLGLGLSIKTVVHDPMSSDYWQQENGLLEHFLENEAREEIETQLVHPYDGSPCYRCSRYGERSKAIAWVRPLKDGRAGYTLEWPGFDGEMESERVYVTLIAAFGPAGDRNNWKAYEAEEWREEDD